jgi:hypothetical protein
MRKPDSWASLIAKVVGAEIATRVGMPIVTVLLYHLHAASAGDQRKAIGGTGAGMRRMGLAIQVLGCRRCGQRGAG